MAFIQLIEFSTTRTAEIEQLYQQFAEERGAGRPSASVCRDRDRPDHYYSIIRFDSVESATANNERPDTQQWAQRFAELCSEPPRFVNLEVIRELPAG